MVSERYWLTYLVVVMGALALAKTAGGACPPADITNDCFVDGDDLAVMVNEWLAADSYGAEWAFIPSGAYEFGDHFGGAANGLTPTWVAY